MAAPYPSDNIYLRNGFEPIRFECDYADLVVEGEIPQGLSGTLYRIGPNPQFAPRGAYNPLLGDGMIHAFRIHRGKVSYRNRWVRTDQWKLERAAGQALFATSGNPRDADPQVTGLKTDGIANTNLVSHVGRLLALEEGHAPIQIDPETLDTMGPWSFEGALPDNMTAHPKLDPETGEMLFFANFPRRDFSGAIELYIVNPAGDLIRSRRITLPYASLVHDFAVTRDFIIFFVCPVTVSIERARSGGPAIAWEPDKRTWIGVLRRQTDTVDAQWIPTTASMVWHVMNAFDDGNVINLDVCQQSTAAFPSPTGEMPQPQDLKQYLTRWRITMTNRGDVSQERLSEIACEYPRIDERRTGRQYRYGYVACLGGPGTGDPFHRAIGRFDHVTQRLEVYRPSTPCAVSEPIFVARNATAAEGVGYLLTVNFDERRNASYLAVHDALDMQRSPIACAHLDHRVPMGFHGTWVRFE
jgi:carotenoid cleavage dioxygenase-like enzyme